MHIEVTDCQRYIPTFENRAAQNAHGKDTARPMKTAKTLKNPKRAKRSLIARFVAYWIVINETRSEIAKP
ncbi:MULTISPECIES: hypothetical protein [Pseudomonas]|uniref:Uncharacterized protein n=1 Tax=Pseudomonas iranensis TaxID=2745503 RepID=A0ABT9K9G2_9PSED|nr:MULTISPECIES: hypothetical protein [Pseudomonas]MDM8194103.1 hypothetical protein [Pseudomonas fluorescens]MDP8575348.1 hypothetical protein [Pseudomonas iranensis]MDR7056902.1 hypothetical protein [Pseudomonas koreensis]